MRWARKGSSSPATRPRFIPKPPWRCPMSAICASSRRKACSSVNPTAILVIEGSGPPEALDVLTKAGVEYQTVPESYLTTTAS